MIFVSAEEVARLLPYEECIPLMREAMIALSQGRTRQLLRSILDLPEGRAFGAMPGAMLEDGVFGAKLVSVYPDNFAQWRPVAPGRRRLVRRRDRRAVGDARRRRDHRDPHRRRLGRRHRRARPAGCAPASPSSAMASRRAATSKRSAASAGSSGSRSGAAISAKARAFAERIGGEASERRGRRRRAPTSSAPSPPRPSRSCAPNGSRTAPISMRSARPAPARARSTTRSSPAPACSPTMRRASAPRAPNISTRSPPARSARIICSARSARSWPAPWPAAPATRDVTIYKSLGSIVQDLAAARHILAALAARSAS